MDGLDLELVDQLDQEMFNGSRSFSDDDDEGAMPLPDCIGIDSAVQDEVDERKKQTSSNTNRVKTRSEIEKELESKIGKSSHSIRGQILEQSLKESNSNSGHDLVNPQESTSNKNGSHVMNIVEKAGMKGIDKEKINEIIHEASKGSLFYKKQAQRQEEIHKSIEKMLNKVKNATPIQVVNARVTCDKLLEDLEKERQFNRVIVHFDLDMFFAAVEIRDNPSLADKPVAVGGDSMVSTSNYIARKFGVRAAMPGFIAKKLCPELLLIKPNGFKYRQASTEVFDILETYDPELTGMSLDEAYLDLTDYVKNSLEKDGIDYQEYYDGTLPKDWWERANVIVEEIRAAIYDKTKLTCSAGIACNTLLAKIATDIKKPNGQYLIRGYRKDIQDFVNRTPIEKVSGIGKVSGQFLHALNISTCGDIYEKRYFLPLVFYDINVKFYLRVAIGDGSTCIKSDEHRKSKSVERTFTPIKDTLMLLDKLDSICEELCTKYLKPYRIRGRTVTVKLKRNTFTTTTKSYSMLISTNDKSVIYSAAKNLLLAELANEPPEIKYRLLGVKLSNLADDEVTANQLTIDAMLRNQEMTNKTKVANENPQTATDNFSSDSNHSSERKIDDHDNNKDAAPFAVKDSTQSSTSSYETPSEELNTQNRIPLKRPASTQPVSKRVKHRPNTRQAKTPTLVMDHSTFSQPLNFSQTGSSQKPSFYQRFIESNSQTLSQSAKFEPFQCPYCMHGFIQFSALETHVPVCIKNKNK